MGNKLGGESNFVQHHNPLFPIQISEIIPVLLYKRLGGIYYMQNQFRLLQTLAAAANPFLLDFVPRYSQASRVNEYDWQPANVRRLLDSIPGRARDGRDDCAVAAKQ